MIIMSKISKDLKLFKEYLEIEDYIEDDRHDSYTIHSLNDILITTILVFFANCNTFVEIHLFAEKHYKWLKKTFKF